MRPRLVDWLLFILVSFEVVTGFISFTVGLPDKRWLFVLHGIVGLALVLLLVWKLQRVMRRLTLLYLDAMFTFWFPIALTKFDL